MTKTESDVDAKQPDMEKTMIKVLVDARAIHGSLHGIARYSLALITELAQRAADISLLVICHPDERQLFAQLNVTTLCSRIEFVDPRAPLLLSQLERRVSPDVIFCPSFVVPIAPRVPLVMTLHDATHLRFPHDYSAGVRAFYHSITLPAARRAACVLTVSDFSRRSLFTHAGLDDVKVIYNGVDRSLFRPDGPCDPRLGAGWILYAGGYKAHKRVPLLLDAMPHCPELKLALAGTVPAEILRQARSLGLLSRMKFLGAVDDEALAACYRSAEIFVYPSAHEGFGLPPLEAMACNTNVVCANSSSLPEVVGAAALRFDGGAFQLAKALRQLHTDKNLAAELQAQIPTHLLKFSWKKAGLQLARRLREAAI